MGIGVKFNLLQDVVCLQGCHPVSGLHRITVPLTGINKEVNVGKQVDCGAEMSSSTDVADSEMFLSVGIIVQIGHDSKDRVRDYWLSAEQYQFQFQFIIIQKIHTGITTI